MVKSEQIEELVCLISSLDRQSVTQQLLDFRASFPVDFTAEFLEGQSVERLRHLFFALCLQSQHIPDFQDAELV